MTPTAFLIPKKGLIVRDPQNFNPLSEKGEEKSLIGKEGRYWRRRIKDGDVTIFVKQDKIIKNKRETK